MSDTGRGRAWRHIGDWLVVLLLPLVFLTTSVRIEMNSPALYTRGFETYDISQVTGIDEAQLDEIVTALIDYFNSRIDSPQLTVSRADGTTFPLYHDYELIHLADVKGLFDLNSMLQAGSLLVLVVLTGLALSQSRQRDVLMTLLRGGILALCGLVVGAVLFTMDFGEMFVGFHLLLFDNSFWQLDPRTDYLVMLFPFHFWQDMFMLAGGMTAAFSVAALGIGWFGQRRAT
jgi:integral membrane protein (TIGR01906 family)